MYEIALSEWKLTPEYINENWTEELLALMFEKRTERILRSRPKPVSSKLSNEEFFNKHPNLEIEQEL